MSSPSAGAKTARPTTSKGRGSCQTAPSAPYNATVLPGNGSELVLRALALRPWWRPTPEGREPHFWWGSNGQHFDWDAWHSRPPGSPKQLVNRLKGNAGISVKDRLCLNLRKYSKAAHVTCVSLELTMSDRRCLRAAVTRCIFPRTVFFEYVTML